LFLDCLLKTLKSYTDLGTDVITKLLTKIWSCRDVIRKNLIVLTHNKNFHIFCIFCWFQCPTGIAKISKVRRTNDSDMFAWFLRFFKTSFILLTSVNLCKIWIQTTKYVDNVSSDIKAYSLLKSQSFLDQTIFFFCIISFINAKILDINVTN